MCAEMREIMKKLSFASPILLTTILLFAAACGRNTATETVPPQTQIASESDFSEETSMNGQTDSITPESSATDLIGNAPSETASGSNSNGNSAANGTAAETQDGLMSGKTSTVTGKIQEMKDFMFVVVSDDGTPHAFSYDSDKRPDGLDQIKSGDRVTVTVTPDKGYELDTITVKDANGNTVKLTDKDNGKYTFTMPGSKVTVSAEFVEEQVTSTFADVLPGSYCYNAVAWAIENGITNSLADGSFGAGGACTRAQCVALLFRSAMANGLEAVTLQDLISGFGDAAELPAYAVPAMNWALSSRIVQGNGGLLLSNTSCTRAQIVTFLYRAYQGK